MSLKGWWSRPIKTRDRVLGAIVGAFAGFWLGLLGRLFLGPTPVSFEVLAYWTFGGVVVGVLTGIFFPRATTVFLYPFAFIGLSN